MRWPIFMGISVANSKIRELDNNGITKTSSEFFLEERVIDLTIQPK